MTVNICTSTFNKRNCSSLDTYLSVNGYKAWKDIVSNKTSKSDIISKIKNSKFRIYFKWGAITN